MWGASNLLSQVTRHLSRETGRPLLHFETKTIAFASRQYLRQKSDKGFTLLELLVALILLSLILGALPMILNSARRSVGVAKDLEQDTVVGAALNFAEQRLSEAAALYQHGDDGRLKIYFTGDQSKVRFLSPIPGSHQLGGLYLMTLQAVPKEERLPVLLRWSSYPTNTNSENSDAVFDGERELVADASSFNLEYLEQSRDGTTEWKAQWSRPDILPVAIRITLAAKAPAGGLALTKVVELKLRPTR